MAKNTNYADWIFPLIKFLMPISEQQQGHFAIDENDAGPENVRLRSTRVRRFITLSMNFTDGQWESFLNFKNYTILQGALPFNIPDPHNYNPDDANTWLPVRFAITQMNNGCWTDYTWNALQGHTITTTLEVL